MAWRCGSNVVEAKAVTSDVVSRTPTYPLLRHLIFSIPHPSSGMGSSHTGSPFGYTGRPLS